MKRKLYIFYTAIALSLGSVVYAQDCFLAPVTGPVTSNTGMRWGRMHNGADVGVGIGTPVYASGGGTVKTFSEERGGNVMIITHPNGMSTAYLHLDRYAVSSGSVAAGQLVAYSGNTGRGTGPHLHFEVRDKNGNRVAQAGNTSWDRVVGSNLEAKKCLPNLAKAGLTPGGAVTPSGDPSTPTTGDAADSPDPLATPENPDTDFGGGANPGDAPEVPFGPITLDGINLDGLLPEPITWMTATINTMNEYKLPGRLQTLGMVLLFACFVYSLVNSTAFVSSDQYFSIFARLIIAAGLIWGTPAITNGLMNSWFGIYNNMEATVVKPAVDDLEEHINNLGPWLVKAATVSNLAYLAAAIMPDNVEVSAEGGVVVASARASAAIDAGEELLKMLAQKADELTRLLFALMCLMGSMYGIYFLAIYTSGMIVIFAGVLLSVLAPFLVLPGSTAWFTRWFSMVFLALVTVTVFPFVMRVAVDQGVNKPIEEMNNIGEAMGQQLDYLQKLTASTPKDWWDIGGWSSYVSRVSGGAITVAKNFVTILLRWFFQSVILAICVMASIFLMQQVPRLITGFVGGAFGGMANATTGSALAGMVGSLAGGIGMASIAAVGKAGGGKAGGGENAKPQLSAAAGGSRAALPPSGGTSTSNGGSSQGGGARGSAGSSGGSSSGKGSSASAGGGSRGTPPPAVQQVAIHLVMDKVAMYSVATSVMTRVLKQSTPQPRE
jgi:hypothetical protein